MVPGSIPGGRIAAQDMSLRVDLLASHELQAQHLIRVLEASLSFHVAHVVVQTPQDTVSEWLRRWTRNPLGSARKGSNPFGVDLHRLQQFGTCSCSTNLLLSQNVFWSLFCVINNGETMAFFLFWVLRFWKAACVLPSPLSPFPQLAMYMPAPRGPLGLYIASWGKGERQT